MESFLTAFVQDGRGWYAPIVVADDTMGVCFVHFREIPARAEVLRVSQTEIWFMFHRDDGQRVFFMGDLSEEQAHQVVHSAKGQENLHLAIEVALNIWPEWCPDLRADPRFKPRPFTPLPSERSIGDA